MLVDLSEEEVRVLAQPLIPHYSSADDLWPVLRSVQPKMAAVLDSHDEYQRVLRTAHLDYHHPAAAFHPEDMVDTLYPIPFAVPRRRWWHWHIKKGNR
jgi:hypothetical protein